MARLENPKHEAYAYNLAKGMKQKDAYAQAGYTANDSTASRLANSHDVKKRVEELKVEIYQKINQAMDSPNEETFGTLKEMGLTMEWCANAFKKVYTDALAAGQFAPANAAVKNIQTMIEIQGEGKGADEIEEESQIKVSEVTAMLTGLAGVIEAAKEKGPEEIQDPADTARDVTPTEITKVLGAPEDVDDNTS